MTVTFRKALHRSILGCLKYITNPEKTEGGTLITGINCSSDPNLAYNEMLMVNRLFNNPGRRVGYHIYQSFNYKDNLTYEEAHQIGIETAKRLYPDYQVVVATHVDHAHIHNHFCFNSVNIKTGKKLVDSLYHEEGISNLRKVSDEISREHNLTVIEDAPPINKYTNRNFIYNFANKSWRGKIKKDIDRLIIKVDDFEELLELLENEGYLINRGKYIGVKIFGMERFVRLKSIDKGKYSEQNLSKRFNTIHYQNFQDKLMKTKPVSYKMKKNDSKNSYQKKEHNKLQNYMSLQQYKMKTMINKQDELIENNEQLIQGGNEYLKRRYMVVKEINQINKVFEIMNNESIYSYKDLDDHIFKYEEQVTDLKKQYNELKVSNRELQNILPILKIYIETFYFKELIEQCNPADLKEVQKTYAKEIRLFNEAEKEINRYEKVSSIEEAKELMVRANQIKALTNTCFIDYKNVIKKIDNLNYIKSFKYRQEVDKLNRILTKGFYANKEQIINGNNTSKMLVKLPNENSYIEVDEKAVAWVNYDKKAYIYIIEDEKYRLYDKEQREYFDTIQGSDIDNAQERDTDLTIKYDF